MIGLTLPAGPFVRVEGTGVKLTLGTQSISGDFSFEQMQRVGGGKVVERGRHDGLRAPAQFLDAQRRVVFEPGLRDTRAKLGNPIGRLDARTRELEAVGPVRLVRLVGWRGLVSHG